jgi:PAS domain S-box-containing protein
VSRRTLLGLLAFRRWWYLAAALIVVVVALSGYRLHQSFRSSLLENFHTQQAMFALSLESAVKDYLLEKEQDLQLVVREVLLEQAGGEEARKALARMFATHLEEFSTVALFDERGAMVEVAPRKGVWSPALLDGVRETIVRTGRRGRPFLTENFLDGLGNTSLALCVPFDAPRRGGRTFVIVGVLRIEQFVLRHFPSFRGRSMGLILADDDGGILSLLSTSHATDEGMKRGNLFAPAAPCRRCHPDGAFDDVRRAFRGEEVVSATTHAPGLPPQNRSTVSFPVYNDRWAISVISPFESVQTALDRHFASSLALTLLAILVVAGVAWTGSAAESARLAADKAEAIRASEEKFRTTFESANDAIMILSREGRILDANRTASERLGYSREEFLGKTVAEIDAPEAAIEVPGRLALIERQGQGVFEAAHRRKDGTVLPVEISARVVTFGRERVILSVIRDITERKASETAQRAYTRAVEEANRMKDLFTDVVRHDLLNPLSVARGYADLLAAHDRAPEDQALLAALRRSLERFTELISSVSDLSRLIETERLETRPLDLGEVVNEGLKPFEGRFEAEGWTVARPFAHGYPVLGNPALAQVFVNLVANAVKFSGTSHRLEVTVRDGGATWLVAVKDWGGGIADADKERIFGRYERGAVRGVKGMGLGLAIVRRIVALHGGSVRVEDNPEGGSVFRVELPKAGPQSPAGETRRPA